MKDDWFACRLMVGFMGYLIVKQIPMDEVSGILEAVDIKSIRTKDIGTDNTSQVITIYDDSYAMCEFDDKTYFFSIKEKSEYSEYDVKPDFVREAGSR